VEDEMSAAESGR